MVAVGVVPLVLLALCCGAVWFALELNVEFVSE
jgi:hypothetical protein